MSDQVESESASTSWYRKVAMVIGWFLLWPTVPFTLTIMIALCLYGVIDNFVSEIRFRTRMRNCGRFLRQRDLIDQIAAEGVGTLIIEIPSLGGITHAWWSPEDILTIAPMAPPTEDDGHRSEETKCCLEWDRWHWDNYVNPDDGKAYLLRVWNGASIKRWFERRFPGGDIVYTWTIYVHIPIMDAEHDEA